MRHSDLGAGDRSGIGIENPDSQGFWRDKVPCKHGHHQWHGGNFVLCGACIDEHDEEQRLLTQRSLSSTVYV